MRTRLIAGVATVAAACIVSLQAGAAASPTIRAFAPTHGPEGVRIAITGTNLAGGRVTFGGHVGLRTTTNASGTKIVTYLPPGLRIGRMVVKVTTRSGSVVAAKKFLVDPIP
jgi:hypothetical protein